MADKKWKLSEMTDRMHGFKLIQDMILKILSFAA
jgi:hypothetical protein